MSSKLSLGGEVILRLRIAAWELCERHERRGWLLALAFAAIVVCLVGFVEPRVREELVAGLKDLEKAERGCARVHGVREVLSHTERRDPADESRVGAEVRYGGSQFH